MFLCPKHAQPGPSWLSVPLWLLCPKFDAMIIGLIHTTSHRSAANAETQPPPSDPCRHDHDFYYDYRSRADSENSPTTHAPGRRCRPPASEAVRSPAAGGHTPLEPPEVIPGTTAWQPPVFLNTFKMVAMLDWPGWEVTTTGANTAPVTIARTGDHLGIYYKAQVWNSYESDTPSGDLVFWERSLVWKTYSDID